VKTVFFDRCIQDGFRKGMLIIAMRTKYGLKNGGENDIVDIKGEKGMLKNKIVIDLLFVMGLVCFGIDAIILVMIIKSGQSLMLGIGSMYFIYLFILGCFIFLTRSLMEMAEAQKKRNEIILEIAKRFDKKE
jgi:hypothetical protein